MKAEDGWTLIALGEWSSRTAQVCRFSQDDVVRSRLVRDLVAS